MIKGKVIKMEKKTFEVKEGSRKGQKFDKIIFTCELVIDGDIKNYKFTCSPEYAKKYTNYCKLEKASDWLGKEISAVIAKRSYEDAEGKEQRTTYIKFMNLLVDGEPVIMPKNEQEGELF